jgi:hypothetical protein
MSLPDLYDLPVDAIDQILELLETPVDPASCAGMLTLPVFRTLED